MRFVTKFLLFFTVLAFALFAKTSDNLSGNIISGKVIDAQSGANLEFTNIVVLDQSGKQVKGTVTGTDGTFIVSGLDDGQYDVKISYIGYEEDILEDLSLAGDKRVDVGTIELAPVSYSTDDVVVSAERAAVSYEIDKKVINVSEQFTASSGTAVDILENVPSVTVDIEGNVSLRGSTSFTVLIDGRPTMLDAADALAQIPSSSIENIEIITNPSAKYNPEGTSGIINIVLKKQERAGISAMLDLNGGLNDKYGAESIVDYKTQEYDLKFGINYSDRVFDVDQLQERRTILNGNTSYINADGDGEWGRKRFNINTEFTLFPASDNIWTIGGRYSTGERINNSAQHYTEWSDAAPARQLYISQSNGSREYDSYDVFSSFVHKFDQKGHEISAEFDFDYREGDERTTNELIQGGTIDDGKISTEAGPGREYRIKADYILPFSEDSKFEAGYQSELETSDDNTASYEYNTTTGVYEFQDLYSRSTTYHKNVHALYSIYSGKTGMFGYQAGLRGEITDRKIEVSSAANDFTINRFDLFPTVHFSYEPYQDHQLMASYTRRINRPRGWNLEPFETWQDAYNVRRGNPALEPEYINSFEGGYQTFILNSIFSIEGYYRETTNKIERIHTTYSDNVALSTFENVGEDYAIGTELMFNFDLFTLWNVNLMGNIYSYKVEGELEGQSFERDSFNWDTRFNNTFKISKNTQIQFNLMYNSPSVSSQGEREGFFGSSLAVRHDMFDKMVSAVLQIRDVFGTSKYKFTTDSGQYYEMREFDRESPMVMLNLKFNFNNYKDHSQNRQPGEGEMDGGGEGDF